MTPHRYVIGFKLNKKMFRLESLKGILIDRILDLKDSGKLEEDFFTLVKVTTSDENIHITITDNDHTNKLTISVDQFIFTKTTDTPEAAAPIEKAIKEFELLWKTADKIMEFPSVRRIGIVVEYRIEEKSTNSASTDLTKSLLKFPITGHSAHFNLRFEDRALDSNGNIPDKETADFWNIIYSFYTSDFDETPEKGKLNCNMDLQKYYNPAKSEPLKELREVRKRLIDEKKKFKSKLLELGLAE